MRNLLLLVLAATACTAPRTSQGTDVVATAPTRVIASSSGAEVNVQVEKAALGGTLPFPVARVWAALPNAYKALGIPVEYAEPRAREVGNTRFITRSMLNDQRMSTYLRCGAGITGPIADSHRIRINIRTVLRPAGADSTKVETLLEALATPVEGSSGSAQECTSAGALEQAIVRRLMWEVVTLK